MAKPIKIDDQLVDIPPAVRCFHVYSSETRANLAASFRVGYRQRQAVGEFYYVHPFVPNRAYPTRGAALRAALATIAASPAAIQREEPHV